MSAIVQLMLAGLSAVGIILEFPSIFGLIIVAVSIPLLAVGTVVIVQDVRLKRESLMPEIIRSLDYATIVVAVFGIQVAMVMVISTGATLVLLILLLPVIAISIGL